MTSNRSSSYLRMSGEYSLRHSGTALSLNGGPGHPPLSRSARLHRPWRAMVIECIMELYAMFYGAWSSYHSSYTWQSLADAACAVWSELGWTGTPCSCRRMDGTQGAEVRGRSEYMIGTHKQFPSQLIWG